MNKLVIPPPPSWYEINILACAPDNTVIYASRNDIIIICPKPPKEPADIKILSRCHRDRVLGVVICQNWGNPDKLAASIADDKVVCLLDIATCKLKLAHSGHTTRSDKLVGVTFAGHDRVISVSEEGFIVIWRWASNQLNSISDLLGSKSKVTCVSSCPHATWLTAFGLKRGDIIITDLRKSGRVLYKLKGHESSITSLSWCPTPYNVFPKCLPKNVKDLKENTKSIVCNVEKTIEDKPLDVLELKKDTSIEIAEDEDATSSLQKVTENINSANLVENISPLHKIDTEEVENMPSDRAPFKLELQHAAGSFSSRDVIDFHRVAQNSFATMQNISTTPKKEDEDDNEDLAENASTKFETKTENINSTNDEKNASLKTENVNKVINTEKSLTETDFSSIISKTINSISAQENLETSPGTAKIETISTHGAVVDIVSNQDDAIILGIRDLAEFLPLKEKNENQESQDNNYENHDGENIKTAVDQAVDTPLKSPYKSSDLLNNENDSRESEDVGEIFQNQSEIKEGPVKEYLLASSARGGRSIVIWRAGTDGIKQVELNLPLKPRGNQRSNQSDEKSWITLCWVTPKNLLSSSPKGELFQWNLATPSNAKGISYKWRLIHGDHQKHIFGIAAPIRLHESPDDEDWRDRNLLNAWTVGKDRFILNTSLCAERKTLVSYPTTSGSINCLASSVVYPSKIAIGGGEGSCRLWDLSRPHLQYIVMAQFSDRSQHKIVSLAWHPTKETILAFGTVDGRIGFMDPCNCSKPAIFFVQHVNGAVHRLEWGPFNGNHEIFLLYAVTGGKLIAYDINKRLDAPIVFDLCENVTQMSWKPDYSVCAVANKAGHVSLFTPDMKLLTTFYVQNKSVRWITWHPEATIEDDGVSPYANWLAVAANNVTVYDCSLDDGRDYSDRIVAVFSEHSKFVQCLSWSTFEGGKLASASDDGTALVWDVKTKTMIHSCVMPNEAMLTTVLWSPLDPDYIITGSKSSIIQIWKLSENLPCKKLVKKQQRKMLKLNEVEKQQKELETSLEDIESAGAGEIVEEIVEEIEKLEKPKRNHRRYVLGGFIEAHNRSSCPVMLRDCKRLFAVYYGNTDNETKNVEVEDDKHFDILKLFGNEHDLDIILDLEKKCNAKKKIVRSSTHISLWQGDIANAIKEAICTRSLNPWIISMAPTVSHNLYLKACEAYADHLSEDCASNPYEIVSYYLACHKFEKAIDLLCTTKNYVEAIVLAKCRLVCTDPLITKIIERWAEHCAKTGNVEVAAQCYIVLRRLEEAAKILFKRTDEETLQFCAELAKRCDNKNLIDAVLFKLNTINILKEDENPEVPLLTRLELELNRQKLGSVDEINDDNTNSKGDAADTTCGKVEIKIDVITENNDRVTLGDGQGLNDIPCTDATKQNLQDIE